MSQATLLERLRSTEILPADRLDDLARLPEAQDADARALAKVVLKRGWLTRYQINQIHAGRGKELIIGSYLLLDRLGEGGMGQVFKAQHRHMGRTVALKLMRQEKLGSPEAVARFYQEVQAAARLTHPNIVIAFDAGMAGDVHFLTMEYIDGIDLLRLVRERGRLPVAQACDFIHQAALGLVHAQEQGMVHRDIKPSNLLVTRGTPPVVKILDMGLARLGGGFENSRNLTRMGQVLGTPDYLAPEQALDARSVDIRADIYSLGCTLFFLLTGRTPFRAEALAELLMKHQMDPAPLLRTELPDAPPALESLLAQMMAKSPDDRPKTPAAVATALEPFARGQSAKVPVSVPPLPPSVAGAEAWSLLTEGDGQAIARAPIRARADRSRETIAVRSPKARRRDDSTKKSNAPLLIGVGIGLAVFLLTVTVVVAIVLSRPAKKTAEPITKESPQQMVVDQPAAPNDAGRPGPPPARKQPAGPVDTGPLFDLIEDAAQGEKWSKTALLGGGSDEFYDIPKPGALLIGFEVGIGQWGGRDTIHSVQPLFQFRKGQRRGPTWGKKTEKVVTLSAKPGYALGQVTLRVGLFIDAIKVTYMAIDGQKLNPADSYDSDWIGGQGGGMRSIGDGTPVIGIYGKVHARDNVINALGLIVSAPAKVVVVRDPDPVEVQPTPPAGAVQTGFPPGVVMFTLRSGGIGIRDVGFTADGKSAVSISRAAIVYYDLPSGKLSQRIACDPSPVTRMAVSNDGKRALTASEKRLQLWDLDARKLLNEFPKDRLSKPADMVLSPDGSYALTSASMSRRNRGAKGVRKREYSDGEIWLWDLNQSKLLHEFPPRRFPGTVDLAFTDDGKYIVTSSAAEHVRIWDAKTRGPVEGMPGKRGLLNSSVKLAPAGGSQLLLGTGSGIAILYDIAEGRENRRFPEKKTRVITRIVTSKDRRLGLVMSASASWRTGEPRPKGYLIWLLDLVKGVELAEFNVSLSPQSAAFSPDNRYLLVGSSQQLTCIDLGKLKTATGEPVVKTE
jgi:serine/threonine protein kinase